MMRRLFAWFVLHVIGLAVIVSIVTSFLPQPIDGYTGQIADSLTFAALYAGVFSYVLSSTILLGYGWRWWRHRTVYPTDHWPVSRQATLGAIGATAIVALQGFQVLTVWDGVLLIVALFLVEISFHVKTTS